MAESMFVWSMAGSSGARRADLTSAFDDAPTLPLLSEAQPPKSGGGAKSCHNQHCLRLRPRLLQLYSGVTAHWGHAALPTKRPTRSTHSRHLPVLAQSCVGDGAARSAAAVGCPSPFRPLASAAVATCLLSTRHLSPAAPSAALKAYLKTQHESWDQIELRLIVNGRVVPDEEPVDPEWCADRLDGSADTGSRDGSAPEAAGGSAHGTDAAAADAAAASHIQFRSRGTSVSAEGTTSQNTTHAGRVQADIAALRQQRAQERADLATSHAARRC